MLIVLMVANAAILAYNSKAMHGTLVSARLITTSK